MGGGFFSNPHPQRASPPLRHSVSVSFFKSSLPPRVAAAQASPEMGKARVSSKWRNTHIPRAERAAQTVAVRAPGSVPGAGPGPGRVAAVCGAGCAHPLHPSFVRQQMRRGPRSCVEVCGSMCGAAVVHGMCPFSSSAIPARVRAAPRGFLATNS